MSTAHKEGEVPQQKGARSGQCVRERAANPQVDGSRPVTTVAVESSEFKASNSAVISSWPSTAVFRHMMLRCWATWKLWGTALLEHWFLFFWAIWLYNATLPAAGLKPPTIGIQSLRSYAPGCETPGEFIFLFLALHFNTELSTCC